MAAFNRAFDDSEENSPIDVTHIGRVLAAHVRPIVVVAVFVAAIVFVISNGADERYRATARIAADTTTTSGTGSDTDPRRLATNVALLTTPDVLDAAARRLPGETGASLRDKLSSTGATDADVIAVTATDDSAAAAAAAANAVARAFLERRTANERAAILRTRAALNAQLAAVGTGPSATAEAAAIRTRLSELVVDEANAGSDLKLAEAAEPPSSAYAPRPLRNAVIAFFATLLLAGLLVVLRDRLRPEAGVERDVERVSGVPVIATLAPDASASPESGRVDRLTRRLESAAGSAPAALRKPLMGTAAKRRRAQAARDKRARAAAGDGLRSMLGAVLLALPPGGRHVILVTSAARGQGSARVAASLARALAQAGQETLAVSADLTSSGLATALGVAATPGLAEALEQAEAGTAVRLRAAAVPGLERLHVVPAGGPSNDGVGLVRPGAVDALFVALGNTGYDYVVVEAPALLSAPEAWLVARNAQAAIVACPPRVAADDLAACRRALERLDVRVLGAVRGEPEPEPEREPEPEPARRPRPQPRRRARPAPEAEAAPELTPLLAAGPETVEAERLDGVAGANGQGAVGAEARLLIERLRTAEQPLTFSQLREALGDPPPSRVRARLRQLVEAGDVVRDGSGRRGDPYVYVLSDR